jgi:T5orf172 domain
MTIDPPSDKPEHPDADDALFDTPPLASVALFAGPGEDNLARVTFLPVEPEQPRASLSLVPDVPDSKPVENPRPKTGRTRASKREKAPGSEHNGRAYALARAYCDLQPMTTQHAVASVVKRALLTGKWAEDEIRRALIDLAESDRRVSLDTLRIALTTEHGHGRRPRLDTVNVVYIIGPANRRPVKIGYSDNVDSRLRALQTGSPLELGVLWTTPGAQPLEDMLHKEFKHYRTHGEWFDFGELDPVTAVARAVKAIRKMAPVPHNVAFDHSTHARLPEYRAAAKAISALAKADLDGMDQADFLQFVREIALGLRYHGKCRDCGLADVPPIIGNKEKTGLIRCEYECPDCGSAWIHKHTQSKAAA